MSEHLPEPIAAERLEPLSELPVAQHAEVLDALYRDLAESLHENGA